MCCNTVSNEYLIYTFHYTSIVSTHFNHPYTCFDAGFDEYFVNQTLYGNPAVNITYYCDKDFRIIC